MLRILGLLAATVLAAGTLGGAVPATALAEPAQQFSLQLNVTRQDGPVGFGILMRSYDTTGVVPPAPTAFYIRFPRGAGIRSEFLNARWWCDGQALRDALDARPSRTPFNQRVANLKPFIRSLVPLRTRAARTALANARACERGRIGIGSGLIDARDAIAVLRDPIPVRFVAFLSRPRAADGVTGVAILGAADEGSPVVRRYPVVGGVHAALDVEVLDDPTPDGLYGLKLLLPIGPINGFDVRIAEIRTAVRSLVLRKGTCLAERAGGRCARRQPRDVHSFYVPECPPSGHLDALAFTGFAPPTPSVTSSFQLPCPRFAP
jgi:hypothetical protein